MIGAIVITYNDDYKIKEWQEHYLEYRAALSDYVIVDNGSEKEYLQLVKEKFPQAHIIEAGKNLGCTGAYNIGIKYLLDNTSVDSICLIGNDIKVSSDVLQCMDEFLQKNPSVGMVEPVLLQKDSNIIEDAGDEIDKNNFSLVVLGNGEKYKSGECKIKYCHAVTGGMNMASRSFYQTVGFQDEKLFMYSDEVDMGLRAERHGYKMACLLDVCAWHQHINPTKRKIRHPYSAYLMGRNKIYLAYKYRNRKCAYQLFVKYMVGDCARIAYNCIRGRYEKARWHKWHFLGAWYGVKKNMKPNRYSAMGADNG